MMNVRLLTILALGAVVATSSGCTSVSRGLGKLTANKNAKPRSGTVWTVAPPQLETPAPDKKTIYISFANITDASDINLTNELRQAATDQGWNVVTDPTNATYRLRARLRFFGQVEPESGGRNIADKMGWIAGAAAGAGTNELINNAADNWGQDAAAGDDADGPGGLGITNATSTREWAAIIDFVLEEHRGSPVEFENFADDNSGASVTTTSDYFPHGIRLSAWANQLNMEKAEALPLIQDRINKVVMQMLPQ